MKKAILGFVLIAGFAAPALAAEFYIVRGEDKRCRVVSVRPTDTKVVIVGNKAYATEVEAQKQLAVVCK